MDNKFWYGLKSEVYVRLCDDKALIYDTKQKFCRISEDKHVIRLLQTAEEDESLGCVLIDESWQHPSVKDWIQSTCERGMAVTFPYNEGGEHPVVLRPLLSLNKDVDQIEDDKVKPLFWGGNVKHFLNTFTIYLNSYCSHLCIGCAYYCKQIPFCTSYESEGRYSMPPHQLSSILEEVSSFPVGHINIFGGDIYEEKSLAILEGAAIRYSMYFRFHTHYLTYRENVFVDSQEVHLLIPAHFDSSRLMSVCKHMMAKDRVLDFVVEGVDDVQAVESFIENNDVDSFKMHPYYNGKNEPFFRENIYMSEEDLMNTEISMREIFRNQKLNANNFGALYVMPDGGIKSHVDGLILGYAGKDEIVDIIYKELTENTAWRKVRNKEPCSRCVFQFLCPPPSNYESAIGKNNLCYMRNNKI